jgi:cytochrome P450
VERPTWIQFCVGAHLARLEANLVVAALLARRHKPLPLVIG